MKRIGGWVCVAAALLSWPWAVARAGETGKTLSVTGIGSVEADVVADVGRFVEANYRADTTVKPPVEIGEVSAQTIVEALSGARSERDALLLGIVAVPETVFPDTLTLAGEGMAFLNITGLMPDPEKKDDPAEVEKSGWLIRKEAMRAFGLMIELTACPNPQCVLWPHKGREQLEKKGANLCPPCLEHAHRALRAKGVPVQFGRNLDLPFSRQDEP